MTLELQNAYSPSYGSSGSNLRVESLTLVGNRCMRNPLFPFSVAATRTVIVMASISEAL